MGVALKSSAVRSIGRLHRSFQEAPTASFELFLASRGLIENEDLLRIMALRNRGDASVCEILSGLGILSGTDLARAQADWLSETFVDLDRDPPSPMHLARWGGARALRTGLFPWRQRNGFTVIVTHTAELFDRYKAELEASFGPVRRAFACPKLMTHLITTLELECLRTRAEHRVDDKNSCRTLNFHKLKLLLWGSLAVMALVALISPTLLVGILAAWAIITLILNTALKSVAAVFYLRRERQIKPRQAGDPSPIRMPKVSILVPLFKEKEIACQLVKRLQRLNYPKQLLDVILVVEQDDETTRETLSRTRLPAWIRTLAVPRGSIKTKPRAMNYALDHCRGSIIGVYDAEDAPDPDQLKTVVRRFSERDEKVACLQGTLDFYNARENWLSRCFTVEYATWFRIILPGLERLGLPVPLGGTTLFFRREALEKLGGWDAHNVTEDADLGIRLSRYGFRTELLPTVTHEEANCRAWPWVRQRSRWLKGYAITWIMHMRDPRKLWNDLGPWRFFGVQLLFAGTLSQFLLAPILWTFWLGLMGLPHPLNSVMSQAGFVTLGIVFFVSEILSIAVGMLAVSGERHKHLMKWVPSLHFYFPLGALAGYKGVFELFYRPFYWDKTEHGVSGNPEEPPKVTQLPRALVASQTPDLSVVSPLHRQLLHPDQ